MGITATRPARPVAGNDAAELPGSALPGNELLNEWFSGEVVSERKAGTPSCCYDRYSVYTRYGKRP